MKSDVGSLENDNVPTTDDSNVEDVIVPAGDKEEGSDANSQGSCLSSNAKCTSTKATSAVVLEPIFYCHCHLFRKCHSTSSIDEYLCIGLIIQTNN